MGTTFPCFSISFLPSHFTLLFLIGFFSGATCSLPTVFDLCNSFPHFKAIWSLPCPSESLWSSSVGTCLSMSRVEDHIGFSFSEDYLHIRCTCMAREQLFRHEWSLLLGWSMGVSCWRCLGQWTSILTAREGMLYMQKASFCETYSIICVI